MGEVYPGDPGDTFRRLREARGCRGRSITRWTSVGRLVAPSAGRGEMARLRLELEISRKTGYKIFNR